MKISLRQFVGCIAFGFWFMAGLRLSAYLLVPQIVERQGMQLSVLQQSFFQRTLAVSVGGAISFTGIWLAVSLWERTRRTSSKP